MPSELGFGVILYDKLMFGVFLVSDYQVFGDVLNVNCAGFQTEINHLVVDVGFRLQVQIRQLTIAF